MVESHAISDATAAIMSGDLETQEAQLLHYGHHIRCHSPLRIGLMVQCGDRAAAAPIAAKIRADDCEVGGEQRRDTAPHQVCLRKAVQQEYRRPGTLRTYEDGCLAGVDFG